MASQQAVDLEFDEESAAALRARLQTRSEELGFSAIGIAPAARPETLEFFRHWIREGLHGEMGYLERRGPAYEHPAGVLTQVRSIVMAALNYGPGRPVSASEGLSTGRMAAYAQGQADYHDILRNRLKQLADVIHHSRPGTRSRVVIDTAPLLERDFARQAGLGWFGKNTMLINKWSGSYFFLGGILTDCELPFDDPHLSSHCGTCTRCLEACPTDAFVAPHVLDARRCISYLTIELRGEPIPAELRPGMQDWMFGCDVCQQVCPWNRKARPTTVPELAPSEHLPRTAREFLVLSAEEFDSQFRESPLARPGRNNMARNAAIVSGNRRDAEAVPALRQALKNDDPVVRGAVVWALGKIATPEARQLLQELQQTELDLQVLEEIRQALPQAAHKT